MNTKVGRPACARRPFIFKVTVRRLDWMVMALICLCPARCLGKEPTKKDEGVISRTGKRFGKTVSGGLDKFKTTSYEKFRNRSMSCCNPFYCDKIRDDFRI